jgi:hypothetical protein
MSRRLTGLSGPAHFADNSVKLTVLNVLVAEVSIHGFLEDVSRRPLLRPNRLMQPCTSSSSREKRLERDFKHAPVRYQCVRS